MPQSARWPCLEERLYTLQDANWNVTALANASGTIQERYAYSAYGTPIFLTSSFGSRSSSSYDWESLYCGYRFDTLVGLYHIRHRIYAPAIHTWLTRDPIAYAARQWHYRPGRNQSAGSAMFSLMSQPSMPFGVGQTGLNGQYRSGMNLYRYVRSNPIIHLDPSGLIEWSHVKYCVFTVSVPRQLCCSRAYHISQEIRGKHKERYGDLDDNSIMNAIYHCVWQCKITHSTCCGARRAKRIGDDHEDFSGNPANNKRMDLHNNEVGREVAANTKDSWEDCYRGCEEKAKSGDLWWFEISDLRRRKWNDAAKAIIGGNRAQNPAEGWE